MKTNVTICLGLLFVLLAAPVFAQSPTPNIATSAVCTHSGGGTTTYGPQEYNNGVIAAAGSTPWGWTSGGPASGTAAWIQFDWPTPVTFGEITLYYGGINTRYMSGADIQYWNGTAWVTGYTWSTTNMTDYLRVLSFAPMTTTKMRIVNWTIIGSQNSNPNFREIEVRNVCTDPMTLADFTTSSYIEKPNILPINYTLSRAYGTFSCNMTVKLYTPTGTLARTETTIIPFVPPSVTGTYNVQTSTLPVGYYRVEVTFNVMDICNAMVNVVVNKQTMVVNAGSVPCVVWPGDVNNDGVANYGDRKSLNKYIYDANLRSAWLVGPARYIASLTNPLSYMEWVSQAGIPWDTPEGCYMDTDGNGYINNFDYVALKLNWMRSHTVIKSAEDMSFAMLEVYPNPFNPSTTVHYDVTERSDVSIEVQSIDGRQVAVLCQQTQDAGEYRIPFNAGSLPSGTYMVSITTKGLESGVVFNKTVKATLSK